MIRESQVKSKVGEEAPMTTDIASKIHGACMETIRCMECEQLCCFYCARETHVGGTWFCDPCVAAGALATWLVDHDSGFSE